MGAPESCVSGRPRCCFIVEASFVAPFASGDESHRLFSLLSLLAFLGKVVGDFGFISGPVGERLSTRCEVFDYLSSFVTVG